MEHEVGVAGDANLGGKNDFEGEILEQRMKGNVDLNLDESGHSDADELSEEAANLIDPPLDSDNVGMAKVGDAGLAAISENNGANLDLSNEDPEAVTGATDSAPHAEHTEVNSDLQMGLESQDEKQASTETIVRDESNGTMDVGIDEGNEEDSRNIRHVEHTEVNSDLQIGPESRHEKPTYKEIVVRDESNGTMDAGIAEGNEQDCRNVPHVEHTEVNSDLQKGLESRDEKQISTETIVRDESSVTMDEGIAEGNEEDSRKVIHVEHAEVNSDLQMGLESQDEKQISTETIVRDESNVTMDEGIDEGNEEDSRNLSDIVAANGEANNINGRHEKMDESNQKPTGATNNLSYLEVLTSSNAKYVDTGSTEEGIIEMQDTLEPCKSSRHETGPVAEIQDVNVQDVGNVDIPHNDSVSHEERNSADPDAVKEQNNVKPSEIEGVDVVEGCGDSSQPDASLQHAAKAHEPVSQIKQADGSQDKTAENNSSTSSRSQPSVDLKQSMLLPERGSQTKENRSKSAADRNNVTSAPPAHPTGLGRAAPLPEPTSRVVQHPRVNGSVSPTPNQLVEEVNGETEEYDETREKLQMIRVKFLRLARRLGQTPHNVVVAQVLYRLGLAEQLHGRSGGRVAAFSFDRASAMAEQLEAAGQEPLDFTCTIMVLGKSGVGKSSTINSIFDDVMFGTDAFESGTKKIQDVVGTVEGIRVRVIDTPGLLPSWSDQNQNEKILRSIKKFIKKTPPDIILYLDRLDMQSRDFGDMPLLRTITDIFGPSIWFNAIVVLTHAASAPPEGPNGTATSYDTFVTQRSHVVQQAIRQAAGDMRLMNPVSLVENHSACRTNRAGQRVLPNGQIWKPHLLLLSFASKILAEANTLLQLQDNPPGRPFAPRTRSPPLPFLLSSLLQSRPEVRLPHEQFGLDDDTIDDDLDESSYSDEESEYDELPPFKSLTKEQLSKLTKEQRNAYYDELEYREKLLMKKQLKDEKKRRKIMKKMQEEAQALPADNVEEESNAAGSVPVPMPDLTLPASFDSDNPTFRYRSLDSSNPWLVRAVLESNGWDHDVGYDGVNVERLFAVKDKVPISLTGHISKDKKDANLQMEIASTVKHGKGKSTSLGFDMQSVGKDYAYTLRSETRFMNHKINKAAAGLSVTHLGDVLTGGIKLEDKLIIGKRGQMVVSGGAIYGRGDVAYGGSLEATLKDKDQPLGRFLSTLGLSVMDWHGDLAIGCNSQTQIPIGRHTNLIGRININNKGSGQASLRINSSEQLQIVLLGLIPLIQKVLGYSQQMQYGQ